MKIHSFQELVARIVHLSTRDGKPIPITWSGTNAWTNPKVVNLPALPAGTTLTPHQFSIWLGYTLHEGPGHQSHTDFTAYEEAVHSHNDPQFSYLLNILEDIRIERADIASYPGDRRHLDATHQFLDDQIPPEKCKSTDLLGLIYKHVFVHYRGLDTRRIQGDLPHCPIRAALTHLPSCQSTTDCIRLAEEVQRLIPKEEQEGEEQKGQGQSREESSPSPTRPKGTGEHKLIPNPNGNEENEDDQSGEDQQQSSDQDQSPSLPSNNSSDTPSGNLNPRDVPEGPPLPGQIGNPQEWQSLTEVKDLIKALVSEITKENEGDTDHPYAPTPHSHTGSAIFPPLDISLDRVFVPSEENLAQYSSTRAELSPQILALKKMFRIHLQAKAKKSWLRGLDDGEELDKERLHIIPSGDTGVFKSHHDRRLIHTAVELMVDLSASMKIGVARSAVIVLAEALSTIPQIKLSISGFTTNERGIGYFSDQRISPNSGRAQGMDIFQFKDFDTPYSKARGKLGAISSHYFTPLGDAYGKALEHLIPRTEPRRILFLITDGKPEFNKGRNHSDYLLMDRIHRRAKALKIETLGLGIGDVSEFLKSYVDSCLILTSIPSLPRELMALLKGIIR